MGGRPYSDPDEARQARTYVFLSQARSGCRIVFGYRWVGDSRNTAREKGEVRPSTQADPEQSGCRLPMAVA